MVAQKSKNLEQRDDLLNRIVGGDPPRGVTGLNEYFSLGTSEDLVSQLLDVGTDLDDQSELAQAARDAIGSDEVTHLMKRIILDTVRGAYFTRDFVDEVQRQLSDTDPPVTEPMLDSSVDLNRTLIVVGGPDVAERYGTASINDVLRIESDSSINSGAPTKDTPGLSAYIVKPVGISPGTKNTSALSLFMNSIPTIEFSRAVPYLEMTIQLGRAPISVDGRLNTPSQLKFIMGAANVAEDTADFSMAASASGTLGNEGGTTSLAGMELFLSPQTMGPVGPGGGFTDMNSPSLRPTDVLDPFRPLASIDRVSIDVAASMGFMSFKTANVELTLHDRSRLHELADFVKPDLYSTTEFLMEYGWHHPDGFERFEDSPFGAMLNAMRVKEKYGIVNSSFNFEDNGEVKISLQLAMKGANEYRTVQIGNNEEVQGALHDVRMLQERIAEVRNAINTTRLKGAAHAKSVFGEQILVAAQSTIGNPTINKRQRKKLQGIIGRLRSLSSGLDRTAELANVLEELYIEGPAGEKSAVDRLQSSVAAAIDRRFTAIHGLSPTQLADGAELVLEGDVLGGGITSDIAIDPFIDLSKLKKEDLLEAGRTSKWVSFGKVFMKFVAEPIAMSKRFDEVQVLFYPLNSGAGARMNRSAASILINRENLMREFETFILDRRGEGISVGEFQNFINQTFIDNIANPSYGMTTLYRRQKDRDGTVRQVPNYKGFRGRDKADQWATELEQKLRAMGVPNGVFRPPQVDLHIEAVPARTPRGEEGISDLRDDATILRIHVFDKAASAYETQGELIRSMADSQLNTIGYIEPSTNEDEGRELATAKRIIQAADRLKILERIDDDASTAGDGSPSTKHFRIVGGPRELKRFVMSTAPYIIFGAQNTAVERIGLASIQDPALSTVNMLRTDRAGSVTPEGSGKGGVPLKTIPARLDATTLGCPLLSFMQQLFVDGGTGTDMDGIYGITQLSHTIEPGVFKSSFEAVPIASYGKYESTLVKTEQALGELEDFVSRRERG